MLAVESLRSRIQIKVNYTDTLASPF